MQRIANIPKRKRLLIGIVILIGFLGLFSFTMTVFAWEKDETIYFLVLDVALLITAILLYVNMRLAFFMTALFGLCYATLLNSEIGNLFVFGSHKNIFHLALAVPYFILLILIPLTISYIKTTSKHEKFFVVAAIIIVIGFPTFAIAEHYNMDNIKDIFIKAKINKQRQVILDCKKDFEDTATFILTTNSPEIADQIKKYGEYYQGSYFLYNVKIRNRFRFSKLKSITITQFDNNKIVPEFTWIINKIKGDISFLQP